MFIIFNYPLNLNLNEFFPTNVMTRKINIEPFIIPQEKLDELKAVLEDPTSPEIKKNTMLRHTGACLACGKMASKIVKYRMFGITKIEKYCDDCLARKQKKLI